MDIRSPEPYTFQSWVGKERMYPPPQWYGSSPALVAQRGRPWNQDRTDVPWLDRADASAQIDARLAQGLISGDEARLLHRWVNDGYFVIEGALSDADDMETLDRCRADIDAFWTTDQVLEGLQVMSLHIQGRPPGPVDHAELLSWPLEERIRLRDSQIWRVHYYHPHSEAALAVTKADAILRMTHLILADDPVLINAIAFKWGSQVTLHQDLCSYHIHPANRLVGVWVAAEDVDPDAGPLAVYPGSHRVPLWPGHTNYPQTNLRTCHVETRYQEDEYLKKAVEGREWKPLAIKKGDVIFQHPLQIHGGDKRRKPGKSRFSLVLHYSIPGGDKLHEVEGPFNW
ncbi:phytanoyl-CoA dioxygenase family protein [Sorangium sp. So ce385]|uniref:phytanoyl-CoA dioxygenase family protein n=1 Tax=Sorangium sp. So ce385 TaxID=3133308 RepID=UPI003F5B35F9